MSNKKGAIAEPWKLVMYISIFIVVLLGAMFIYYKYFVGNIGFLDSFGETIGVMSSSAG